MKPSRRDLLRMGAALAAGGALGACRDGGPEPGGGAAPSPFARPPNLVVLFTDQERRHVHFPPGFIDRVMPSWGRLRAHGLELRQAFTSSTQCSPARACMLTGEYSNVNGVPYLDFPAPVLPAAAQLPNVATVLRAAGYDVVWKGKWHLSFPQGFTGGPPSGEQWVAADGPLVEQTYGWTGWNPPDCGNNAFDSAAARATMGGAVADNDGRIVAGITHDAQTPGFGEPVVEYLARVGSEPARSRRPFCLFVSLVNPHDIVFYPNGWDEGGYELAAFDDLDIGLPPSAADPLTDKPTVQAAFRAALEDEGPLPSERERLRFVRFYAYLHAVVEPHIQSVLDALDRYGLTEETVVVRTVDHGEHGLAHGLREKGYSAYEESIHVPLVVSNPRLFPRAVGSDALCTHVDLLPTLAELAGAAPAGVGTSLVPVFADPEASVQSEVLYAYDDSFILPANESRSHIRALRDARWTYAVYYSADGSSFEYELYDNPGDADQMVNLLHAPAAETIELWQRLHRRLTATMVAKRATPAGFDWPDDPTVT